MNVTCQKYGDPTTRQTFAYATDGEAVAVADHYYLTHFPEWEGAVTLVEVLDGPVGSVGVWHVEDLGRVAGLRSAFARRARTDEITAVESGDAVRINTALAATDEDRKHLAMLRGGAMFLEGLFAPHRMAQRMLELGNRYAQQKKKETS